MANDANNQEPNHEIPRPTTPGEGLTFKELSFYLAIWIPITFCVLGLIEALSLLWRPIAIVLYLILLLFSLLIMFGMRISPNIGKIGEEEVDVALFFVSTIFLLVSFSQLSRHLYLQFGGFQADQVGYWHWLRFGIQNILESILLDIPAIYDWNISEIRAITFGSRTLLFLFRTSLELMVITQLLQLIRFAKNNWRILPSSQHKFFHSYLLSGLGKLIILGIWSIPISICVGAIANDGFSIQSAISVLKICLPLVFGFWLAWTSLVGMFRIRGGWNKIIALVCILIGFWLIHVNWSQFLLFLK